MLSCGFLFRLRHQLPRAARCTILFLSLLVLFLLTLASGSVSGAAESHEPPEQLTCGFEALSARTTGTRVLGVSRVAVVFSSPHRSIAEVASPAAADSSGDLSHARDDFDSGSSSSSGSGGSSESASSQVPWQPIRIRVFTEDLRRGLKHCTKAGVWRPDFEGHLLNCTELDVLTDAKKSTLTELLIPQAVQLHEDRLKVQPVNGNIVVGASISSDPVCSQFAVPDDHKTTGVSNADFVLYLAAGPTNGNGVWATTCQRLAGSGRPSVGVINVSPKYIAATPKLVRVIAHELLHALGFNAAMFQERGMYSTAPLRGKGSSPVIKSAKVVEMAKAQYGCATQEFMELEDMGGSGTAYSHWKRRSAKDELMAGISGVGHYTALTIAAMEDMKFYQGNYANAEPMSYGQNVGCTLTTSKCVIDGVSQFSSMFCAGASPSLTCTTDHTAMGYCDFTFQSTQLPSPFQYFASPNEGGVDSLMDYCPYVQAPSTTNCSSSGGGTLLGNVYGVNARCFNVPRGFISGGNTNNGQLAICADVLCGSTTYGVKVLGATAYVDCTPGRSLVLSNLSSTFTSGLLTCPSYDEVCVGQVNASLYATYSAAMDGDGAVAPLRIAAPVVISLVAVVLALLGG